MSSPVPATASEDPENSNMPRTLNLCSVRKRAPPPQGQGRGPPAVVFGGGMPPLSQLSFTSQVGEGGGCGGDLGDERGLGRGPFVAPQAGGVGVGAVVGAGGEGTKGTAEGADEEGAGGADVNGNDGGDDTDGGGEEELSVDLLASLAGGGRDSHRAPATSPQEAEGGGDSPAARRPRRAAGSSASPATQTLDALSQMDAAGGGNLLRGHALGGEEEETEEETEEEERGEKPPRDGSGTGNGGKGAEPRAAGGRNGPSTGWIRTRIRTGGEKKRRREGPDREEGGRGGEEGVGGGGGGCPLGSDGGGRAAKEVSAATAQPGSGAPASSGSGYLDRTITVTEPGPLGLRIRSLGLEDELPGMVQSAVPSERPCCVLSVRGGSQADRAGIKEGDVMCHHPEVGGEADRRSVYATIEEVKEWVRPGGKRPLLLVARRFRNGVRTVNPGDNASPPSRIQENQGTAAVDIEEVDSSSTSGDNIEATTKPGIEPRLAAKPTFMFRGKEFDSYAAMVDAKKAHNAEALRLLGLDMASAEFRAAASKGDDEKRARAKKRAVIASSLQGSEAFAKRRKSGRLEMSTKALPAIKASAPSILAVSFCRTCNKGDDEQSKTLPHHVLCPSHPQFATSGAREKVEKIQRNAVDAGCEACSFHLKHGRRDPLLAHSTECDLASAETSKDPSKRDRTESAIDSGEVGKIPGNASALPEKNAKERFDGLRQRGVSWGCRKCKVETHSNKRNCGLSHDKGCPASYDELWKKGVETGCKKCAEEWTHGKKSNRMHEKRCPLSGIVKWTSHKKKNLVNRKDNSETLRSREQGVSRKESIATNASKVNSLVSIPSCGVVPPLPGSDRTSQNQGSSRSQVTPSEEFGASPNDATCNILEEVSLTSFESDYDDAEAVIWELCGNPWGNFGQREDDVVLISPLDGLNVSALERINIASPRFNAAPFREGSSYTETHRNPSKGLRVLKLTRDAMDRRPWGLTIKWHEFGGACLVDTIAPLSPADAAVDIGGTPPHFSDSALEQNDMILCVNGKSVGNRTLDEIEVEIEISCSELLLVASQYRTKSCHEAAIAKKDKNRWSKIATGEFDWTEIGPGSRLTTSSHQAGMCASAGAGNNMTTEERVFTKENDSLEEQYLKVNTASESVVAGRSSEESKIEPEPEPKSEPETKSERGPVSEPKSGPANDHSPPPQSVTTSCCDDSSEKGINSVTTFGQKTSEVIASHCSVNNPMNTTSAFKDETGKRVSVAPPNPKDCIGKPTEKVSCEDKKWEEDDDPALGCICGETHEEPISVFWIQCDSCQAWYNVAEKCIGFNEGGAAKLSSWVCLSCVPEKMPPPLGSRIQEVSSNPEKESDYNVEIASHKAKARRSTSIFEVYEEIDDERIEFKLGDGTIETRKVNQHHVPIPKGGLVRVSDRTAWDPKKEGGVATIIARRGDTNDGSLVYDVRYVLGGREMNIGAKFVVPEDQLGHTPTQLQTISPRSGSQCRSEE